MVEWDVCNVMECDLKSCHVSFGWCMNRHFPLECCNQVVNLKLSMAFNEIRLLSRAKHYEGPSHLKDCFKILLALHVERLCMKMLLSYQFIDCSKVYPSHRQRSMTFVAEFNTSVLLLVNFCNLARKK